jgi:hypothetical protein
MQGTGRPEISFSQTTARAPRAIASAIKSCPSAEPPGMATKRFPGSNLRLSMAMPVMGTAGICAGEKGNGNPANMVCKETANGVAVLSMDPGLFIFGSFTINKKDLTGFKPVRSVLFPFQLFQRFMQIIKLAGHRAIQHFITHIDNQSAQDGRVDAKVDHSLRSHLG